MSRVTKRLIDSMKPPEKGEAIYWDDDELKGFAVRVWPSRLTLFIRAACRRVHQAPCELEEAGL